MITNLLAARSQMALSLGFHIIFASFSVVMPFLMCLAHYKWIKTKNPIYEKLRKAWLTMVGILFIIGAVSGTILSFELGLLWPTFMKHAGPIIGMPFSLEGSFFMLEAIFLALYIFGEKKLNQKLHFLSGLMVGITGLAASTFVIGVNSWMNSPSGFDWVNNEAININPFKALLNDAWFEQSLHSALAMFQATSFALAGLHSFFLLKNPNKEIHKIALKIILPFAVITSLIQPISGDLSAKNIAENQPVKLAAMESHFHTQRKAPIIIGGIPDTKNETVKYGLKIPGALSFLAFKDFNAEVKGLTEFPKEDWPPVAIVHFAFQIMVGIGTMLALFSSLLIFLKWRKKNIFHKNILKALIILTPAGFIALEAGWTVTEVGRQPWIIHNILRTKDALTPVPGLTFHFLLFTTIYILLGIAVIWMIHTHFRKLNA